jgi:HlyD family secretion protein
MMTTAIWGPRLLVCMAGTVVALCLVAGCKPASDQRIQGYVEGEFVYVASPLAGTLEALYVQRGTQVKAGDVLFRLDSTPEKAARDEAERRLAQARANWEDAKKGKRPSEIEAIEAQLKQARVALALAERELTRMQRLGLSQAIAPEELDRARSRRDQDVEQVLQREAELKTARLGARPDQIKAAEAEVEARKAALAQAEWNLAQKQQAAPQAGPVLDTLYREGEWVAAGRPVVALLPPQNIKVRAFIPETRVAAIQVGDRVRVIVDGSPGPFDGKVSFISPRTEFTPPVIYSRESRSKLVIMIELVFAPEVAAKLHPGQPVDVEFGP